MLVAFSVAPSGTGRADGSVHDAVAAAVRVVRESGARISVGQGIVRQLPMFLEIFMIDVLFALFTEKSQRAFEVLSRTRVVVTEPEPGVEHASRSKTLSK